LNLKLTSDHRSGNIVIRTHDLNIGYPDTPLFAADDIELHRQECAALIGPNGAGKTTFLRTVLGELEPLEGEVQLGASLKVGYFAQAHSQLNLENTVLDELLAHQNMQVGEARNYLARYLFQGDDVFRQVKSLSGGERGRLALALLALDGANFLLLDEPTNHLDIPAQEVLQEVLENFDGTILLVSHDRYLVNRLATQIWWLQEGRLEVFDGPYQSYMQQRQIEEPDDTQGQEESNPQDSETTPSRVLSKNELRRLQQRLRTLEEQIGEAEYELEQLAEATQDATRNARFDKIRSLSLEYAATERTLESLMQEWERVAHEVSLATSEGPAPSEAAEAGAGQTVAP
jgi:ATP-binding cassette subfamily F protein 3